MVKIIWKVSALPRSLWSALKWQWKKLQITRQSLFYNHFMSRAYVIDVLMEPIFWFVDNFVNALGPFFVVCVCLLTASVTIIAYWIGIPYYWDKSPGFTVFLIILGHWLLANISFHYYMAWVTLPGQPPEGILIPEAASMCKKCIAPKPPRTHHCSACDKCILKMDHHCPWLDNCIGHFNHRYFYMYMVYVVLGVLFIIVFGLEIAYTQVWLEPEEELTGHPVRFNDSVMFAVTELPFEDDSDSDDNLQISQIQRRSIIYVALLCASVFLALGGLSIWHGNLITRGETSVEAHINKEETKRLSLKELKYANPYDFGPKRNWSLFLGLVDGRSWRHLLIPSTHKPLGNGLSWATIYSDIDAQAQTLAEVKAQDAVPFDPPVFEKMNVKKRTLEEDAQCFEGGEITLQADQKERDVS